MVEIQAQDNTGNWRTYNLVPNIPAQIRSTMEQLRWNFPDARIRAVDQNGSVVDIL
jgi:hypothetical protein